MLKLKNMFIFAPIKTGYGDGSGKVNERHIAFYKRICKYLGAVIPEPFYLDKGLREIPAQLGIDNDDKIKRLQKLTSSIHKSGAKVIAHLNHPGRMTNPNIPGNYFISSTDRPCENGGATPTRMDKNNMKQVTACLRKPPCVQKRPTLILSNYSSAMAICCLNFFHLLLMTGPMNTVEVLRTG